MRRTSSARSHKLLSRPPSPISLAITSRSPRAHRGTLAAFNLHNPIVKIASWAGQQHAPFFKRQRKFSTSIRSPLTVSS
jgi:hypothetical protein